MKQLVQIFSALGDETRLQIVKILTEQELCACHILDSFSLSQPAISHHLKVLKNAGIVLDRREGKWIYYRLNAEILHLIETFLAETYSAEPIK